MESKKRLRVVFLSLFFINISMHAMGRKADDFISKAKSISQAMVQSTNILLQEDRDVGLTYLDYWINFFNITLDTMINPLLHNFSPETITTSDEKFRQEMFVLITSGIGQVSGRIKEIQETNPLLI